MLQQFLNHLSHHALCSPSDSVLLAVSGGRDSMVMMHLFLEAGYKPAVVHCNFGLRPEAIVDQQFVEESCRRNGLRFFSRTFDTRAYAEAKGLSIQVAARDLRYEYFYQLINDEGFACVATAHHALDNIETVLLNLVRGTGLDGLTGIPVRNGRIIRPLLFANRKDIDQYSSTHKVSWIEDSSNQEIYYSRNFVRHNLIPGLKELNPSLEESVSSTLHRLRGARYLASRAIGRFRESAVTESGNVVSIDRDQLHSMEFPEVILWEIIKHSGFSFDQCKQIVKQHQTGRQFISSSHQLVIDRSMFVVRPNTNSVFAPVLITEYTDAVTAGSESLVFREAAGKDVLIQDDRTIALLDRDCLKYPLIWRKWSAGDSFVPLGMKGRKKISDFLIDLKVSHIDKGSVTVLESAGEIVWVVGLRISDQAKITASTARILIISYQASGNDFA